MTDKEAALLCKAIGDLHRLQIVQLLTQGEQCACELLEKFSITQPTLSHHMRILGECGLVNDWKEGRWHHYSLNCETLNTFKVFIEQLSCCKDESGCCGE